MTTEDLSQNDTSPTKQTPVACGCEKSGARELLAKVAGNARARGSFPGGSLHLQAIIPLTITNLFDRTHFQGLLSVLRINENAYLLEV